MSFASHAALLLVSGDVLQQAGEVTVEHVAQCTLVQLVGWYPSPFRHSARRRERLLVNLHGKRTACHPSSVPDNHG